MQMSSLTIDRLLGDNGAGVMSRDWQWPEYANEPVLNLDSLQGITQSVAIGCVTRKGSIKDQLSIN